MMTVEELEKLEDFATDVIITHAKLDQAIKDANSEGIQITQKLLSLYVDIKSLIRKNTKQQEDD